MIRLFAILCLSLLASPVLAHKVIFDVFTSGDVVKGEVGFSNGTMAAGLPVTIETLEGDALGEVLTDADGVFTFVPTQAVTHVFKADLGSGHVGTATLSLDDLPHGLSGSSVKQVAATPGAAASLVDPDAGLQPSPALSPAQTELVAEMLRDELRPLRREIASYREKNDLQTILGGMGYIAGIFGLGFYLAAQRKLKG